MKWEEYCLLLLYVVIFGNFKFFFGIDSVFYVCNSKESLCGCVGCYFVFYVMELYVEVFESVNFLDKLEVFVSFYGLDFY